MQTIAWLVLTQGRRPRELAVAVTSLLSNGAASEVIVWCNGCDPSDVASALPDDGRVRVAGDGAEHGVPGGRDRAFDLVAAEVGLVGFLDDDAELIDDDAGARIIRRFQDSTVAVVGLRLADESGETARRHIPRSGTGTQHRSGPVATFLGGASVIRRSAYLDAGRYWSELEYGHEELDLSWRLIERGWVVFYCADVTVFHPRTEISRHGFGWSRTGRNRVLVARRDLPVVVLLVHVTAWLILGTIRAPRGCRVAYVRGWMSGWRQLVPQREAISWRTTFRLARLGRPPIW